ncbi:hypothetical protein [Haliscomenobacter sp.]|uniref:hypothetical protein n=1 Tax=Haliscomenobacter sp. TaxID=2717303 RepID=UPI003BAAD1C0
MEKNKNLENIRDLIATGKIDKAFDELKNLSKIIGDKKLRNAILLNCFSYQRNYNAEMLNLQNDSVGINRAVLKTLEFIDEIEEQLNESLPQQKISSKGSIEIIEPFDFPPDTEKKIAILIEKYFGDILIERGDLSKILTQYAVTITQFEEALLAVKENFDFFRSKFSNSSGMTLSNLVHYAIDAIFVPKITWKGSNNRLQITNEFKDLIDKRRKIS